MAKELDTKKMQALVKVLKDPKKGFGKSETFYCDETGIAKNEIAKYLYRAELEADPSLKITPNGKGIVAAAKRGHRWPRIAIYAGISVAAAQKLYQDETGQPASAHYTGRGRKFDPNAISVSGSTSGTSRASGSKAKTKTATSGRRTKSETKKTSAAPGRRPGRRTSRAAATASDPK